MTDAHSRVPNEGQDVDDATEAPLEYEQLGSDGNPFERVDAPDDPVDAESTGDSPPPGSDADFGMGIPAANDPQQAPDGAGPT